MENSQEYQIKNKIIIANMLFFQFVFYISATYTLINLILVKKLLQNHQQQCFTKTFFYEYD